MNRKLCAAILVALPLLAVFLTSCSSSSKKIAISATSGSGQTATVTEAFANPLVATVTSNGTPASGVTVTFSGGSSGAGCTPSATSVTTDASGHASITCTANGTPGTYSVTATAAGATTPASFSETNAPPILATFYVSGLETANSGPNYYAIAGAVAFDSAGNIIGGEQDYNNGYTVTASDAITAAGSSMTVDPVTGMGTLVVATANTSVGNAGVETFSLQFANGNHALITQFDGSATSSGSMDLQSSTSGGNFAFTLSGVDINYFPVAYGGVFTSSAGTITGTADVNDDGTVTTGATLTGTASDADAYGRGTASITINGTITLSLVYYNVTPQVMRLIDMGPTSAASGSAYAQGTGTFDSTSLSSANVFGMQGNSMGFVYAATGMLAAAGTAGSTDGTLTGVADVDEESSVSQASTLSGTYSIGSDGYGAISMSGLQDVAELGIYMTDPALNLSDPNNTTGGGGALLLDLSPVLAGGTGIVIPQTSTADFSGNTFSIGTQQYWGCSGVCEFDYVGQASIATGALTGIADVNDLQGYFAPAALYTGATLDGTAVPDVDEATTGRYTLVPLSITPTGGTAAPFTMAIYEASPSQLFWIDEDDTAATLALGTLQAQNIVALKSMHVKKAPLRRARTVLKPKH